MHTLPRGNFLQGTNGSEQEGIVVWDQKGLVVLWPDGHCSRFFWNALRQTCPCDKCQKQCGEAEDTAKKG